MPRPTKDGLDYFPLETKTESDIKFQIIEARFGIVGFGIIIKLYQLIYSDKGYYTEWNELISTIAAAKWSCPGIPIESGTVNKVVRAAAKYGIFSEEKLNKYGVLTSEGIQKRYVEVSKRRKNLNIKPEYLLISVPLSNINVCNNSINVCNNSINACNNQESKVNKNTLYKRESRERTADTVPPDLPEVKEFVSNENLKINPDKFYHYYQGKKWQGVSDWKAKAREWNATEKRSDSPRTGNPAYNIEDFERKLEEE